MFTIPFKPASPNHRHPAQPYSHFEHPRVEELDICPSAECRRRKRCVSAYRDIYCLRLFQTTDEMRGALADKIARIQKHAHAEDKAKGIARKRDRSGRGMRELKDELQARMEAEHRRIDEEWKAGKLDHLYGPYSIHGFFKPPPPLKYVEILRDADGKIVRTRTEGDFRARAGARSGMV